MDDIKINIMKGGLMSNIGDFLKKNAVWVGVGVAGLAGTIYLMTRKKKSNKGLLGASHRPKPRIQKRTSSKPKRIKAQKLT